MTVKCRADQDSTSSRARICNVAHADIDIGWLVDRLRGAVDEASPTYQNSLTGEIKEREEARVSHKEDVAFI